MERVDKEKFTFGTYLKISAFSENKKQAEKIIDESFEEIERIDSKYNSKTPKSLTSELNKKGSAIFDEEGIYLLDEVKKGYNLSNGKYDITMGPLMKVWGFSEEVPPLEKLPLEKDLNTAASKVDFSKVKVSGNKIYFETQGMEIDTGSFLKGYAVEKAKEKMVKSGIKSGFITSISSISAIGGKGDGSPWKIGIQNPDNPSKILGTIDLKDQSMGVSGDYQTYIEIDGEKYHHILDKSTKYPVSDKKMVVVVNKSALDADMYSTVFFLMPIEEVIRYANNKENLDVLIVDNKNIIYMSKNIKFKEISN